MTDSIRLAIYDDFSISPKNSIVVEPGRVIYKQGEVERVDEFDLFAWENGSIQKGRKAYMNTEILQASIKQILNPQTGESKRRLSVQFSVPRILGRYNLFGTTQGETLKAVEEAKKIVKESGINTNLDKAKIARMDLAANIEVEEDVSLYIHLLSRLQHTRIFKKVIYQGETVFLRNRKRQLVAYNKVAEMMSKIKGVPFSIQKMKILRFESRAMNKDKVKDWYNIESVEEFEDNYKKVTGQTLQFMRSLFSMTKEKKIESSFSSDEMARSIMKNHYASGDRYWMRNFYKTFALYMIMQNDPEGSFMRESMKRSGVDKSVLSRFDADIRMLRNFSVIEEEEKKYSKNLFNELKLKLKEFSA